MPFSSVREWMNGDEGKKRERGGPYGVSSYLDIRKTSIVGRQAKQADCSRGGKS